MGRSYAIFLDGGFVKHKLRRNGTPVTAAQIEALINEIKGHPHLVDMHLHRAYFYDAKPLREQIIRPDGTVEDFSRSTLARTNDALHAALANVPFLSLRFGELGFNGWQHTIRPLKAGAAPLGFPRQIEPKDLKPDVKQKGVDMRIGLDMASLTLKEHVEVIALVTGDSDFVPAMKFARREGAQVLLFTLGHGIKDGLVEHADLVVREPAGSLPTQ